MSPAAVLAAAGVPTAPLIASIQYAPGVCATASAAIHGDERGLLAAKRIADSVCRALDLTPPDLNAEPATENPGDMVCYVLDARPGRNMARLARVIGLTDDGFMDGMIAAHLGDGARRRALHRALGEG